MACVTLGLKRPLEFDPVHSPTSGRSAKRRRCLPFHADSSPSISSEVRFSTPTKRPSAFAEVENIFTAENIASSIRDEIKRLQRRKQLPTASGSASSSAQGRASSPSDHMMGGSSPPHIGLMSLDSPVPSPSSSDAVVSSKDRPIFTVRQVSILCERLLRERETALRTEYDETLNSRLAEQYDTFVKFTYDQIQHKFESAAAPSYLS